MTNPDLTNLEIATQFFTTGGTVQAEGGLYVARQADAELLRLCQAGEFAYVLTSRQMGKSSLMVRTAEQLREGGCHAVILDLTAIGTQLEAEQWYFGVLTEIEERLELETDLFDWWEENAQFGVTQRLTRFFETVVLPEIEGQLVIFIDEIDTTLGLSFTDDFFIAIRQFYTARPHNPIFKRLSFVLIGVATPGELIHDPRRTPFNIGQRVDLTDFTFEEALPFTEGLRARFAQPEQVLQAVLAWTGGQPFLTQRICRALLTVNPVPEVLSTGWAGPEAVSLAEPNEDLGQRVAEVLVDKVVRSQVLENWEVQDEAEHLKTIRGRVLAEEANFGQRLGLYRQILQSGTVPVEAIEEVTEQVELLLSGLIRQEQRMLRVANRLYESVFDLAWVDEGLERLRPYAEEITAWLASGEVDESQLLRGERLWEMMTWSAGKRLGADDYRFLGRSQELQVREVQQQLQAAEEANRQLEESRRRAEDELGQVNEQLGEVRQQAADELNRANEKLEDARVKTERLVVKGRRTQRVTTAVATCALAATGFAAGLGMKAEGRARNAEARTTAAEERERSAQQKTQAAEVRAQEANAKAKESEQQVAKANADKNVIAKGMERAKQDLLQAGQAVKKEQAKVEVAQQKAEAAQAEITSATQQVATAQKQLGEARQELNQAQQGVAVAEEEVAEAQNKLIISQTAAEEAVADAQRQRQEAGQATEQARVAQAQSEKLNDRVAVQSRNLQDIFEISEGVVTYAQGEPEKAIKQFTEILNSNGRNSFALIARGEALLVSIPAIKGRFIDPSAPNTLEVGHGN